VLSFAIEELWKKYVYLTANIGEEPFRMNAPKAARILCASESKLQITVDSPPFFVIYRVDLIFPGYVLILTF
jgi:hypothetical protein